MRDVILSFLRNQSHFTCLTKQILNQMSTPGSQTFQIMLNWNKKCLSTSQKLLEKVSLKFVCYVIFASLHGQPKIFILTMSNFRLGDYSWRPSISISTLLKKSFLRKTYKFCHFFVVARPSSLFLLYHSHFLFISLLVEDKFLKSQKDCPNQIGEKQKFSN